MTYLHYSPEVKYLLINHSNEKVEVLYASNPYAFRLPLIGTRPPYYTNPRYEQHYPII
ncbi:hypothetical protein [Neobacillus sp. Marseille-QA0830]